MTSVLIVGASLGGLSAARSLRAAGYDGRLTIVGAEAHLPYDRPPLSKRFLTGESAADSLRLSTDEMDEALDAEWLLGATATALRPRDRTVRLDTGRTLVADGVIVATGASARRPVGVVALPGVHTLRSLDDAIALRADLSRGPAKVVVIGAGFIGSEVASSARTLGHDVTVVDAMAAPLERQLGPEIAAAARALAGERGVRVRTGVGFQRIIGTDRVTGVAFTDGSALEADVVVIGIGVDVNTSWLDGSGVLCDDGVVVDGQGATSVPHVFAVGDVARYPSKAAGRSVRVEHWTNAQEMPRTAASALLAVLTGAATSVTADHDPPPYFWSDQYGVKIQCVGHLGPQDVVRVVNGSIEERRFTAAYQRDGRLVGGVGFNDPKSFNELRRRVERGHTPQEVSS